MERGGWKGRGERGREGKGREGERGRGERREKGDILQPKLYTTFQH